MPTPSPKKDKDNDVIDPPNKTSDDAIYFMPKKKKKSWLEILAAYEQKFKRGAEPDGALSFETQEQARQFFTEQATANHEFLVMEVTPDRKPTGQYMFSCGNGTLYAGTLDAIKQKIENELKQGESPKLREGLQLINSHTMRDKMSTLREDEEHTTAPTMQKK
jgi:hypothetical protein